MADPALWLGAVAASSAAAAALIADNDRFRSGAMVVAIVLAPALLAADNWNDDRLRDLRDSPEVLLAAAAVGALLLAALVALMLRRPGTLALLAVAALPFRVPVEAGGETSNLLLPLYVVIAAGVAAEAVRALRPSASPPRSGPGAIRGALPRWLGVALGGYVLLYTLQGAYADDFSHGLADVAFFFVPFAVLAALLARVDWSRSLLAGAAFVVVAEAVIFALVGFVEYSIREVLWNPRIIAANEVHSYFRVNSLFWDPNMLGRYLAVSLVLIGAVIAWASSRRAVIAFTLLALGLLAALAITFSQSSLIALLAGLTALVALRWSVRWTLAGCVAGLAAFALVASLGAGGLDIDPGSPKRLNVQTSGRVDLVGGGLELAAERPVLGYGSGTFQEQFRQRFRSGQRGAAVASHTEPVTVAAERGAVGLVAYLGLLVLALGALATGIRQVAPGIGRGRRGAGNVVGHGLPVARVALLAGFVAMIVHSLFYAAFFTDPITWVILGVGVALAGQGTGRSDAGAG